MVWEKELKMDVFTWLDKLFGLEGKDVGCFRTESGLYFLKVCLKIMSELVFLGGDEFE